MNEQMNEWHEGVMFLSFSQVPCKMPCLILWMITQALNSIAPSALPTALGMLGLMFKEKCCERLY